MGIRRYDHPNTLVRRTFQAQTGVTSAGTFAQFFVGKQNIRLVAAHAIVTTQGTNASALEQVRIGTDSVGVLSLTTNTVSHTASIGSSAGPLGTATAGQIINCLKTGSAGGAALVEYEYEVLADADLS